MKTILLADDSITIQKVVELTFSEGNYQVVCVSNGAQALRKIPEVRPDIVLLDVIMPEKNGYDVCEEIKRTPATSGIPVLLLTGTFEPFDRKRAEAVGAQGHLTKPFESQALIAKVEELIASRPTVVSSEEAGAMDVISGGDVYHVEPGRQEEGLRPSAPPVPAGLSAPSAAGPAGFATGAPPSAPAAGEAGRDGEAQEPAWPHPALAPPDPAAGGSYVGFADLGMGTGDEGEIVPDRFDEASRPSPSTARLDRSTPFQGERSGDEGTRAPASEPDWTPPPEAPPAETWQSIGDEPEAAQPAQPRAETTPFRPAGAPPAAPAPGNGPLGLTPEAIDLIAERVVERLSDRVVREIAWEVIPQVAEALVRRRIKELEEGEGGA